MSGVNYVCTKCNKCWKVFTDAEFIKHCHIEETNEESKMSGVKHDQDKARMDLLSPIALEEMSKVLTFGAKKYGSWNWSKGVVYTRLLAAILRHTTAYMRGQDKDPETGISHMAHVMVNCQFILHFEQMKPELDDREKTAYGIGTMSSKS